MNVENFNPHEILFSLERFTKREDKLGYLYKMKKELQRIIKCFEANKTLPLKMYAVDNIQIEGNCAELKTFIRDQFKTTNKNSWEKRNLAEEKLRTLLIKEVMQYKKIVILIDGEIKLIENRPAKKEEIKSKPKKNFIIIKEIDHIEIAFTLRDNKEKIFWEHSVGELIELVNSLMNKKLVKDLNESNMPQFITKNFVDNKENDFSLEKIEKVYGLFLKTIWSTKNEINTRYFQ